MQTNLKDLFHDKKQLDPNNEEDLKKIIRILKTNSFKRDEDDLGSLYHVINNNPLFIDFLQEMPEETSMSLLRSFRHVQMEKGQEVFRIGDTAKFFYLILKGSVHIMAPLKQDPTQPDQGQMKTDTPRMKTDTPRNMVTQFSMPTPRKGKPEKSPLGIMKKPVPPEPIAVLKPGLSFGIENVLGSNSHRTKPTEENYYVIENNESEFMTLEELNAQYPKYALLNTLYQGTHFGEIALSLHTFRTATVVCREACHFLVLNSSSYYRILGDYQDKVHQDLFEFLKASSLIRTWASENIIGLMRHAKTVKAKRNHVVYDYGDPADQVYIIRQGEIEIIKETDIAIEDEDLFKRTSSVKSPLFAHRERLMGMNSIWKKQYEQVKKQHMRVALLGPYQSFGEEETTHGSKERVSRAIVKSQNVEFIAIPVVKLIENAKEPMAYYNTLCNNNPKKDWREKFENNIAEINSHNDPITKPRNIYEEKQTYVHVFPLEGMMKPTTKKNKLSLESTPTNNNNQDPRTPMALIKGLDMDFFQLDPISPPKSPMSNALKINKFQSAINHQAQNARDTAVIRGSSLPTKPNSGLLSNNRLWQDNLDRHQKFPRRFIKGELSPLNSKKTSTFMNSLEVSQIKTEKPKIQSQPGLKSPNIISPLKNRSAHKNEFLTSNLLKLTKNTISPMHTVANSQRTQEEESFSEEDYKKMLSKKLGVDRLFFENKNVSVGAQKSPIQIFVNTSAQEQKNSNLVKPQTSSRERTTFSSLSNMTAKAKSNANMAGLSPSVIRKLKTQMGSRSQKIPIVSPQLEKPRVSLEEAIITPKVRQLHRRGASDVPQKFKDSLI